MNYTLRQIQLENNKVFKIAHGARKYTDTLILEINIDGITAFGEGAHVPYYGISTEQTKELLSAHLSEIISFWNTEPAVFWPKINQLLGSNHYAKCIVDMAHYDWLSQKAGVPLALYIGSDMHNVPLSSFTIGIDSIENMISELKKSSFPIIKVKLGTSEDDEIIDALLAETNKTIRVDVNAGWDRNHAIEWANRFYDQGIEFLEQPFPKDDLESTAWLKENVRIPIIADESVFDLKDVVKCAAAFHGINIKLTKCGGIYPALLMIQKAKELGLKTMLGCMTESSIGISALAHMAALVDYIDMDGATLIKNDPAEGVQIVAGKAIFKDCNGHSGRLKIAANE